MVKTGVVGTMKQICVKTLNDSEILKDLFSKRQVADYGYYNGYPWLIIDNSSHYCAYIGLPESHEYYGKSCGDIDLDVNGGITYSEKSGTGWIVGWDYLHSWNLINKPTLKDVRTDIINTIEIGRAHV